jgi:hypothetical protein
MPFSSPISPAIQNMIGEQVALAKSTFGSGSTKNWLFIAIAVVAIIFFVKKVT